MNGLGSDPNNPDTDGDGVSDGDEVGSVLLADSDGDGLGDAEEAAGGSAVDRFDTDGDGIGDGMEVARGTDPLDPASRPAATLADMLGL